MPPARPRPRPLAARRPARRARRAAAAGTLLLVAGAALSACGGLGGPAASRPTPLPPARPARLSPAMRSPLVAVDRRHGGHFALASTGATVQLRGFDYQPLVRAPGAVNGYVNVTFSPATYRHDRVETMTAAWQADGYDATRVLVNPTEIGDRHHLGLDPAYVADLADFLRTAAEHGVRTMLTVGSLPTAGGFTPKGSRRFGLYNDDYLDPAFVRAEQRYLGVLVADLRAEKAPLVDVLWELKSEQDWNLAAAPLDWHRGTVRAADGHRYDMARPAAKLAMERSGLAFWANRLAGTLHRLVPHSLVGVGVYSPAVHHRRWAVTPGPLFSSATTVDFVDVHVYPNLGSETAQMAGFHAAATRKPVVMGEFGATRAHPVRDATAALVAWQEQSCHLGGLVVSGWLLWTWNATVDREFWAGQANGGEIARALAPATRPDPCGAPARPSGPPLAPPPGPVGQPEPSGGAVQAASRA